MSATWKAVLIALVVALAVTYLSNRQKLPIINPGVQLPKTGT